MKLRIYRNFIINGDNTNEEDIIFRRECNDENEMKNYIIEFQDDIIESAKSCTTNSYYKIYHTIDVSSIKNGDVLDIEEGDDFGTETMRTFRSIYRLEIDK